METQGQCFLRGGAENETTGIITIVAAEEAEGIVVGEEA
jgi:hypothetical protein